MDHKLPAFVAYAALVAQSELGELLRKHRLTPTTEMLADAAKFGVRRAFERFFPGLVKLPFQNDPHPQVVLALRYLHEEDPEGVNGGDGAGAAVANQAGRYRVSGNSTSQPRAGMSDTQQRLSGIIPTRLADAPSSTRNPHVRQDPSSTKLPFNRAPNDGTGQKRNDDSTGGVGAGASADPTRLRRVGPAPVFPWQKRRQGGDNNSGA